MQRYDSYKDSGIQWLGEIPSHWEVKRIASLGFFSKGGGFSRNDLVEEDGLPAILYGDIYTKYNIEASKIISKVKYEVEKYSVLAHKGDLLMTGSGETKEDIGKTIVLKTDSYIGGDVIRFSQKGHDSKFLSYFLNSQYAKAFRFRESKGEIIVHIYASALKSMYISLPPLSEQQAIASYLDTATAKIDEAIAQQQKMIDLLNERKQIIINNAVTKGLNPNAKMKPSGIDWIGEIPEHWEVLPLKRCCSNVRDRAIVRSDFRVALENIEGWTGQYLDTDSEYEGQGIAFQKDDVLFGKLRPYLAKVYLAPQNGEALGDFWVLRPNQEVVPEYLHNLLLSKGVVDIINSSTYGTKMPRADWQTNSKIQLPIPPLNEQHVITDTIKKIYSTVLSQINICNTKIAFLQERKQIIINDVVTGKVKVV